MVSGGGFWGKGTENCPSEKKRLERIDGVAETRLGNWEMWREE